MSGKTCWVCGSGVRALVRASGIRHAIGSQDFAITDARYGVTGALYRCGGCGFLQCAELDDVSRYYEALIDEAYESGREQRAIQARRLLDILRRHISCGRLLDIGAGSGILIEQASSLGYEAEGVEPSRWLQQRATERRLKVHLGPYPHPSVRPGFDVVTLIDVIEHVPNPVDLLQGVASQLASDGIGLVVTPDIGSWAAKLMGQKWWHFRIAHIGYFSRSSLRFALDRAGLVCVEIGRPSWYFSLDYLLERVNIYLPRPLRLPIFPFMRHRTVPINLRDSLYVVFRKKRDT